MTTQTAGTIPLYRGHWMWGSTLELAKHPTQFFEARSQELGDTFYAAFPINAKILMTANPDLIKYVLQTNHKNYEKDKAYDQLALLLGNGLVSSRGEFWKKQRRIAQPAFYKKSIEHLYQSMSKIADEYIADLATKRGQVVDISKEMMAVTAKIAMKTLFSEDMKGDLLDIYNCISDAQEYVTMRSANPLIIPWYHINGRHRQFIKQRSVMDRLIYGLIDKRKSNGTEEHHDFLQMLLDARYEETGEAMELVQLRDELVTIFSAGHETSSNGLAWILYLLCQHPEVVEKLRSEASRVLRKGEMPKLETLKQLSYTRQVIEEGMRLYPPVWGVSRYAKEEDEWNGHPIKAGTITLLFIYHLHRHADLWENPESFDPDRFAPEKVKIRPKAQYLPFGAGPRMCLGNHFAMMEMQLLLPLLVQNFDFELVKDQPILLDPKVTLRPKYGIQMRLS